MAEEAGKARALELWTDLRAATIVGLLTRHRVALAVGFTFFLAAFLVFWYLGPQNTPYISHVNVANAFLHGRLDLLPELSGRITEPAIKDGKFYEVHPPFPAIIVLPGVALYGLALNQTLVSAVLGGITASVVFGVVRAFNRKLTAQLWLTALFIFGTVFWYAASHGGVWFFSHTSAVLFLFLAIYVTLVYKNPLLAGLFLGAAYWSRTTTVLALPFFIIMFSDQWLPRSRTGPLIKRIDIKPLVWLALGLGVFVLLNFTYNYLRFGTPLDAAEYNRPPEIEQERIRNHGNFDLRYISRHVAVFFEKLPRFRTEAPYVTPSWSGMAVWATTPALFYALFAGIRNRRVIAVGAALLFGAVAIITTRAIAGTWDWGWARFDFPYSLHLFPFFLLIGLAIITGFRDKLIMACWAAIMPIVLTLFIFAGTGAAQFGYRFSLDFLPFLFLLVLKAVGDDIRWHHMLLILISVSVNLWGALWIYQFSANGFLGLRWVGYG